MSDQSNNWKKAKLDKELEIDMRFNENFNRTSSRRIATKTLFDGMGRHRATGADACDCLEKRCVGCFFPCSKCKSTKCGTFCRRLREDDVVSIQTQGKNYMNTNVRYIKSKAVDQKCIIID